MCYCLMGAWNTTAGLLFWRQLFLFCFIYNVFGYTYSIYIYVCVYKYMYVYINIYICIHRYIYIHMDWLNPVRWQTPRSRVHITWQAVWLPTGTCLDCRRSTMKCNRLTARLQRWVTFIKLSVRFINILIECVKTLSLKTSRHRMQL